MEAKKQPAPATGIFVFICVAALGGGVALVLGAKPNVGFGDAGAVLVFAGLAAVAIERVIEGFWIVAEKYAGKFWPFSDAVKSLNELTEAMNKTIKPAIDAATANIDSTNAELAGAKEALTQLQASWNADFTEFKKHLPDNRRVEQLSTIGFQAAALAQKAGANAAVPAAVAQQAVSGAVDFLATFKDNPAKRMVSTVVGISLGLVMAGLTGLDLLSAGLAESSASATGTTLGVLISGIVIGLGSGPTHTVISTLAEVRNSRRGQTQALPSGGTTGGPLVAITQSSSGPSSDGTVAEAFVRAMSNMGAPADTIRSVAANAEAEMQQSRRDRGLGATAVGSGAAGVSPFVGPPSTLMLRR